MIALLCSLCLLSGTKSSLHPPWPVALRTLSILSVVWTVMANLMKLRRIKRRKLLLYYSVTNYMNRTLLGYLPASIFSSSTDQSLPSCGHPAPHKLYRVLLVSGSLLVFFASSVTDYAQLKDFTLQSMIIRAVLDAQVNLTLSHVITSVLVWTVYLHPPGDRLLYFLADQFLHELITRVFLRSLQYGIVVMGFLDAFVHAHHQHRRTAENPGNFGDCMNGRIRFMMAVTSACAHAYQATCLSRLMPAILGNFLRLTKLNARYPHLPNARSTTRERGDDFQRWPSTQTEVLASRLVKLSLGHCTISPWKDWCHVWSCNSLQQYR